MGHARSLDCVRLAASTPPTDSALAPAETRGRSATTSAEASHAPSTSKRRVPPGRDLTLSR